MVKISDIAAAYKSALISEIGSFTFRLDNGEVVSVQQLVDEANAARKEKKAKRGSK